MRVEEIKVALLARLGHGEAKGAMTGHGDGFLWVCVCGRILLGYLGTALAIGRATPASS